MTAFLLVRHASHDWLGKELVGRRKDVSLGKTGQAEALALAECLRSAGIDALYTSPLQRCRETARAIAAASNVEPKILPELNEIDFGNWAGLRFADLQHDRLWDHWNQHRSDARAPNGETMQEVQQRILGVLDELHATHWDQVVAVVSHGDVIKAALLSFLNQSLDLHGTLELLPARVSVVAYVDGRASVLLLNDSGERVPETIATWRAGAEDALRRPHTEERCTR